MTEFKPGDRVRYIGRDCESGLGEWSDGNPGTIVGPWNPRGSFVKWDGSGLEYNCRHYNDTLQLIDPAKPPRPLVGPAPKDESPIIQASFSYDEEDFRILDAKGRAVLNITLAESDFPELTDWGFDEFGKFVVAALNAHVFGEE